MISMPTKETLTRYFIRKAINKYNKRVAKQLSDYMKWPEEEILQFINLIPDNKDKGDIR